MLTDTRKKTILHAYREAIKPGSLADGMAETDKNYTASLIGFAWCAAIAQMQVEGFLDDRETAKCRNYAAEVVKLLAKTV